MRIAIVTRYEIVKSGLTGMILQKFNDAVIVTKSSLAELEDTLPANFDIILLGSSNLDETDTSISRISLLRRQFEIRGFILLEEFRNKRCLETLLSLQSVMQGFITLECDSSTLASCLSAIYKGKKYISQELAQLLLENYQAKKPAVPAQRTNLTKREFEIANMLINGIKVSDVAKQTGRKISTISTIKKNILRKTNAENLFSLRDALQN